MGKAVKKVLILTLLFLGVHYTSAAQSIYRRGNFFYALEKDSTLTHDYWYYAPKEGKTTNFSLAGTIAGTTLNTKVGHGGDYLADIAPGFGFKKGLFQIEAYVRLTGTPGSSFNTPNWRIAPESFPLNTNGLSVMPGFVVNYNAGKHITVAAGYDKNFIGEGYHSLFLSDNSSNYPFLKAHVDLGKLKYSILYAYFQNQKSYTTPGQFETNKFGAFHTLTYSPWKWIDIQLFESVIWQNRDSLQNRAFEVNYLNPVIFYRPVEYNTGSADNELLGWAINLHVSKNVTLYSQFVLDEFLLSKFKENTGWWANKYGMLAGMKCFNMFGVPGLSMLGEVSVVRPFTYSHRNPNTNYASNYQPLAHPWGANFYQLFGCVQYANERHRFAGQLEFGIKGFGNGVGGNIFPSNDFRLGDYGYSQNFGQAIAIGNGSVLYAYRLRDSRKTELFVQAGIVQLRNQMVQQAMIGIRTPFFNSYSNY